MQNTLSIIISTLLATTLMTGFSYYLSFVMRKQFREPELLNKLLARLDVIGSSSVDVNPLGWFIHYVVGMIFIVCYEIIWGVTSYPPTLANFMFIGSLFGLLAIVVWAFVLRIHPRPPKVDHRWYFLQLFIAHIIFGIGAFWGASLFGNNA